MKNKEKEFYEKIKDWDFSLLKHTQECLTNWDMYTILKEYATEESRILDLGTGGGEKVLKQFPNVKEILATDYSQEMINTANQNLKESNRKNITFRVMNNLKMDTKNNYFDIVVARHTVIDPKQIYNTLKENGILILRGVDKLDCWQLKRLFKRGQAFNDIIPISLIDYENILNAGFKDVELIPIYCREYYATKNDLLGLLLKTPILNDFSENDDNAYYYNNKIDMDLLDKYIAENTSDKGILLRRRYYGIVAKK